MDNYRTIGEEFAALVTREIENRFPAGWIDRELWDDREFYELCQAYRHAPFNEQLYVAKAFDAVVDYAKSHYPSLDGWQ